MKTILKIFILCTVIFLLPFFSIAQDIHFSQFNMSPLTLNPALAGAKHDMQATFNYKDQWQSVASPYKTMAFSYDMRLNKKKSGKGFLAAGVNFFSDRAGDAKMGTTQADFSLAYHVHLGTSSTLGAAMQAGFMQRSLSASALQWGNQYDGTMYNSSISTGEPGSISSSKSFADFGAGLLWNYNNQSGAKNVTDNHDVKFHFGISFYHLSQPNYSFYGTKDEMLYMKTVVHGGAILGVPNTNIAFAPSFMYYRQGPAQEILAGTYLRYMVRQDSKYTGFKEGAAISFGGFLRAKDAAILGVLFEYSHYALGVSYDVNISSLRTSSSGKGGLEISLRFVNPNPFQVNSGRSQGMFN